MTLTFNSNNNNNVLFILANETPRKHCMFSETNTPLKLFPSEFWRIILVEAGPYHQHPYL
jgi:hypothetical protein